MRIFECCYSNRSLSTKSSPDKVEKILDKEVKQSLIQEGHVKMKYALPAESNL